MKAGHFLFAFIVIITSSVCVADSDKHKSLLGETLSRAIVTRYQPTLDTITHAGWDHSNSVVLHGMEKVYRQANNPSYLAYIKAYVDTFVQPNGDVIGLMSKIDGMHPAVLCLFIYKETGDKKYLAAAKTMRDYILGSKSPFQKTPDGAYWHKNSETSKKYNNVATVDGLYMVHPFLVHYGVMANDEKAINVAIEQVLIVSQHSFNITTKLPYHAWDYDKTKSWANPITGTSSQFWSRASGWYAMALVDILEYLPKDHKQYSTMQYLFQQLAEGLSNAQNQKDGFWYQVLDKPNQSDNYPEISGTGMITYALQKGVNLGLLDKQFHRVAQRGWQALQTKVGKFSDGGPVIHSVCPGMGAKNNYNEYVSVTPVSIPGNPAQKQHMHGYMAVLMAASVMEY